MERGEEVTQVPVENSEQAGQSLSRSPDNETPPKKEKRSVHLINVSPCETPTPSQHEENNDKSNIPVSHQNGKVSKGVAWSQTSFQMDDDNTSKQSEQDEKQDLLQFLDQHGLNSKGNPNIGEKRSSLKVDILGIIEERDGDVAEITHNHTHAKPIGFLQRQLWQVLQPSDNRLSMKLFGSKKGLQKEKHRLRKAGVLIIHPCSHFRSVPV